MLSLIPCLPFVHSAIITFTILYYIYLFSFVSWDRAHSEKIFFFFLSSLSLTQCLAQRRCLIRYFWITKQMNKLISLIPFILLFFIPISIFKSEAWLKLPHWSFLLALDCFRLIFYPGENIAPWDTLFKTCLSVIFFTLIQCKHKKFFKYKSLSLFFPPWVRKLSTWVIPGPFCSDLS